MIELKDLAQYIQEKLNDVSSDLNKNIVFKVADNVQDYETYTQIVDGDTKYNFTPAIVRVVSPVVPSDELGLYQGMYNVEFYGYKGEIRLIESVVNKYTELYGGAVVTISDKVCGLSSSVLSISDAPVSPEDGFAHLGDRFIGGMDIAVVVSLKGTLNMGKESELYIDNVQVFYNQVSYVNEKSKLNTEFDPSISDTKLVSEMMLVSFNLPVAETEEDEWGSKKINELFSEGLGSKYNQKHTIKYATKQHEKTTDYIYRKMEFLHDKKHTPVGFTITFEKALEREPFLLNGKSLNILSCNYMNGSTEKPVIDRISKVAKNVLEASAKSWTMTIEHDNSQLSTHLLKLIVDDFDLDNTFVLTEKIQGWDYDKYPEYDENGVKIPKPTPFPFEFIEKEYTVCAKSGAYSKGLDGVLVYQIVFVEVR